MKQEATETKVTNQLVQDCASFASAYSGNNYFTDLAEFLAKETDVEYVLIGYLNNGHATTVTTAALFAHGKIVDNMVYSLAGTPCENVMGRNCCYYPVNVQQMFPNDKELQELNINSYIGAPLFDTEKNPLGIVVLMDSETIPNAGILEKALEAIAPRTEIELQLYLSQIETEV